MPITLVFTTGDDLFQGLIGLHTESRATHVAIGLGAELLHAQENGVCLDPRGYWFGTRKQKLVAEFAILPDVTDGASRALSHVGERFGWFYVFKAGLLRRLAPLLRSLGLDPVYQQSCTQLVLQLDPQGERIVEWQGLWPRAALAPSDLLEVASWGPSFRRIA